MKTDKTSVWSDNELIREIKQGNSSKYFEILYNRYHSRVLDKCNSLVKNKDISEELTEDIFSKTFEKLHSFKHLSSFSSWLFSITYNHCIDYLREKKRLNYSSWASENEIPEIVDESEETLSDLSYDNLLLILDMIHPEEKALLLMKYKDNLSVKQIGISLRISESAVKMRLKRARTRVLYLYKEKYL